MREEREDNLENPSLDSLQHSIHQFHSSPESPQIQFTLRIARIGSPSPNAELVCTKEEDGDVMFIEIILKDDNSHKEEPEPGVQKVGVLIHIPDFE
ncbi:hypothetical protein Tco_0831885 [Tanacetum coccineum]